MALNFNPYQVKLAVSTGSKGRGRFEAGRIRVLKNEWKAMGLRLVPPKDAEYIILPDGSNDKGQGGRYATAIHYSDFIELLSRSQRPLVGSSPTSRLVVRSRTTEAPDDTPEHRILRHNVTQGQGIDIQTGRQGVSHKDLEVDAEFLPIGQHHQGQTSKFFK